MTAVESVQPLAQENAIHIYTRHIRGLYPALDVVKGVVEFDPPIPEQILKNKVLTWVLLDPTQRKFVSYEADEQGLVAFVTHSLRTPRNNFRNRGDLMDYYYENGGDWHLESDE